MNIVRLFATAMLTVCLVVATESKGLTQNPEYPGFLGVRVWEDNQGMRILRFIPATPAAALNQLGEINRNDVIMRLGGRPTTTIRRLLQARNRIPSGMEAKMILRSRNGYVYHIWISRNEAAAAAAARVGGPDVPLKFKAGARGVGDENQDFRPKGGGAPSAPGSSDDGGDFRPKPSR